MKSLIDLIKRIFSPPSSQSVLVVDDSDVDRHLAARILERKFRVLTASTAKRGLEMALEDQPALILLDVMMPDVQGTEVCRILKCNPRTRDIPVIFLTGQDTPATVIECFDGGADTFLAKPIRGADLLKQVDIALNTRVVVSE
jgi:CheY-like chemotaxis protein